MTRKIKHPLEVIPDIEFKMEMSKEDVVAIAVADHERKLMQARVNGEKQLEELREKKATIIKEHFESKNKAIEQHAKQSVTPMIKSIIKLMGGKESAPYSIIIGDPSERTGMPESEIKGIITYTTSVSYVHQEVKRKKSLLPLDVFNMTILLQYKMTKQMVNTGEVLKELEKDIKRLTSELWEIRKALSNIEVYERQAKAAMARKTLESSTVGKQILNTFNTIQEIPGLPIPKKTKKK